MSALFFFFGTLIAAAAMIALAPDRTPVAPERLRGALQAAAPDLASCAPTGPAFAQVVIAAGDGSPSRIAIPEASSTELATCVASTLQAAEWPVGRHRTVSTRLVWE